MARYAEFLLRPFVKTIVIVGFAVTFGFCLWSASKFHQHFDVKDILPGDSYAIDYLEATELYTDTGLIDVALNFRDVDQSDPEVQAQMRAYANDVTRLKNVENPPDNFWLDHFHLYVNLTGSRELPFTEQLDLFLDNKIFYELYNRDIARDDEGNIVASRTRIKMSVDLSVVQDQIDTISSQREITMEQPINQGKDELAFFMFNDIFFVWEFYLRCVNELFSTTIIGVLAVTAVALIFIPHWTAALFVFPLICVLYVDLLGAMQWGGLHINALTYVSLAVSIGLLVDFVMHVLFRYYECAGTRKEKTVEMLKTMGSSILLGGTTTFLGTIPLMFTTSEIFQNVFISFLGIVTIGVGHGLILLPVLLSTFGPEAQISMTQAKKKTKRMPKKEKLKKEVIVEEDEYGEPRYCYEISC